MRQFFKILFACLCAIILFFLIVFVSFTGLVAGLASGTETTVVEKKSVLLIDLNQTFNEQSEENKLAALNGMEGEVTGLNDILKSIKNAATDENVNGIYIRTGISTNGWATLKEVRDALLEFRKSNKFILAYGEVADQKSYYVVTAADKVYINPSGGLEFKGLSMTGTFFKGALDKLDVNAEAFHCGKYKGAYEPFKLDKFSEPNRYQLSVLLGDMYSEFLQAVSAKTTIDTAELARIANEGKIKTPYDALSNHFIDAMIFSDSVDHLIRAKLSLKEKDEINFITPLEYASTIHSSMKIKDKIAVLYASGEIHDGEGDDGIYSKDLTKTIRKIAGDETIKGVVLRVNSPGGSAMASEIIYHELMQLKAKKPLVVSMGNYAASGGYYISCAADSIFADQTTLTGSIGVVGVMFNINEMMRNKLGVTFDHVKTGQYADFPNMTRPMTEFEHNWIQAYLDSTYMTFKQRVADARKLSMEQVEELAQGHVYSGHLAKELKLVDGFGNTDRALQAVKAMAKLKEYKVVEYPKPVDKLEQILSSLMGKKKEEAMMKNLLGADYTIFKEVQRVRQQQNKVQAILPMQLDIR